MILVDSNIPMYMIGAEHPRKHDARRLLDGAISRQERLVTDAEVLQEILHRFNAVNRPDAIQPAFDALLGVVDEVVAITQQIVLRAKDVLLGAATLSARDAVHVAAMEQIGATTIMSFDRGFDAVPGISRLS